MLKPGTYKLARDVDNPRPDRRKTTDWTSAPVWHAGTEFLVEPVMHRERNDEPIATWTRICLVGHRYKHESIAANGNGQYEALEAALEPCEMSDEAFFTAHSVRERFVQWLISTGRLTRELYLRLADEYDADGELTASDPLPHRTALVDPSAPPAPSPELGALFEKLHRGLARAQEATRDLAVLIAAEIVKEDAATHATIQRVAPTTEPVEDLALVWALSDRAARVFFGAPMDAAVTVIKQAPETEEERRTYREGAKLFGVAHKRETTEGISATVGARRPQ